MSNYSKIGLEEQLALRLQQKLSQHLDQVITDIEEIAKQFDISSVKEKSPLKNVLSVAMDTSSSLGVIKVFILSQSGRKDSSPIWKLEHNSAGKKTLFCQILVERLYNLSKVSHQIVSEIKEDVNEKLESLELDSLQRSNLESLKNYLQNKEQYIKQSLHLKLTQLYLGYLSRQHTALLGIKNTNNQNS